MRDMMLRKRRDLELFRAYQKALQENNFSDQREAVDYVRKHEAPRWFVSKEFCAAVISNWLRGKEGYKMRNNKKRKFRALFDLYLKLRQEFPYSALNHLELCATIVEMPAPEWFIDHQLASRIIKEYNAKPNAKYELIMADPLEFFQTFNSTCQNNKRSTLFCKSQGHLLTKARRCTRNNRNSPF